MRQRHLQGKVEEAMKADASQKRSVSVLIEDLDAELHRRAKQAAQERRLWLKDWMTAAIAAYVRQHERRMARRRVGA
jgi:hypothetical protein